MGGDCFGGIARRAACGVVGTSTGASATGALGSSIASVGRGGGPAAGFAAAGVGDFGGAGRAPGRTANGAPYTTACALMMSDGLPA